MSLSDRRTLLKLLLALPLAGCGFTPLLKEGAAARDLTGQLHFNLIESAEGFALLQALEGRFGKAGAQARYDVTLDLSINDKALALDTKGLERHTLSGKVKFKVIDRTTGKQLFTDMVRETTGYSATSETLVTRASEKAARQNLANLLANAVALRLISTAGSWAK